jgi:hypothetical protein
MSRLVLTGKVGDEVRRLLVPEGWMAGNARIIVDPPDVMEALMAPEVVAVLAAQGPEHQRRITPPPPGGLVAVVIDENAQGRPVARHLVPIDQTIPAVPAITAALPHQKTLTVVEDATVEEHACHRCHSAAARVWSGSGHARPWAGLPTDDRVDACLPCHITPRQGQPAVAGVGCLACHLGAEDHGRTPTLRPPKVRLCRDCHDPKHDPAFDPEAAWQRIKH